MGIISLIPVTILFFLSLMTLSFYGRFWLMKVVYMSLWNTIVVRVK